MKWYTTGQVAKICGFKSARIVAKLIDDNELKGEMFDSQYERRRTRKVRLSGLYEFMKKRRIPLGKIFSFDPEVREWVLSQRELAVKKAG